MRRLPLLFMLILLLAACRTAVTPAPSPVSPTPAVSVGAAASPTSRPSPTARPTQLPSPLPVPTLAPSPTPSPEPTPTPAFPRYTGPPLDRADIGIQLHLHREDQRWLLRHLQALGVGWVKVQVSWKLHEPQPGQYDAFYFDELDRLVDAASNNGIRVLLSVSKAPEWSRPTTELDGPPADFAFFAEFMTHLATRYHGRVAAYELWNEPNLQREWNGAPLSAADLVRLTGIGAAAVRAADPTAVIVSAAPATTGINDGVTAVDDRAYLRQMLEAGVAGVVDAVGVHPYGWANPPDSSVRNPDPAVPSHNNHPSFFWQDTLDDYATLLAEFGAGERPLWVTEFGWGSFDGFGAPPPAGAEFMANVSEWQQAVYTLRAYELAHARPQLGPMFLWNLNFAPTLGTAFSESGYSILRPDGSRRPLYLALEAMPKQ